MEVCIVKPVRIFFKEEAEELKAALTEAGAEVEVK